MLYDIKCLSETGTEIDCNDQRYDLIETEILRAKDGIEIAELCSRTHGIVIPLTERRQESLRVGINGPKLEGAGLLYWTDGDPEDDSHGVNVLDAETTKKLSEQSLAAIVGRVLAHYAANPGDDGHPAYELKAREIARQSAVV